MKPAAHRFLIKYADKHWWNVSRDRIVESLLQQFVGQGKSLRILEVGCGNGHLLAKFGPREQLFGFDKHNSGRKKNFNFLVADIHDLPYKKNMFDVILAIDVIEHINEDRLIVGKIAELLKKDGVLCATVPAFMFLWSDLDMLAQHKRRYTKNRLEHIFQSNNLRILKISYMNFFLFIPIATTRLFQKIIKKIRPSYNSSSLTQPNACLNQVLKTVFCFESFFLKRFNFPVGASLLVFSQKNKP